MKMKIMIWCEDTSGEDDFLEIDKKNLSNEITKILTKWDLEVDHIDFDKTEFENSD